MPVRTSLFLPAACCIALLSHPAAATQLYKWVDQRGVTNYSDQPPAAAAVKKHGVIEDRVSVYTPDPLLSRAMEAERARALDDLRTGRRAQEQQQDWLARQYLAAVRPYAGDPCAGSFDPRCTGYTPYAYAPGAAGIYTGRRGVRVLPQIVLPPGTTAGNVTGNTGFIPGNSAFAPGGFPSSAPRTAEAARPVGAARGRAMH
ncbi:MAG TPA: DUF4124 domain-containing protein [Burkholderiales bacterium]|nr:DUF4124 domain-containing protein [Burkholderiales bacterium]